MVVADCLCGKQRHTLAYWSLLCCYFKFADPVFLAEWAVLRHQLCAYPCTETNRLHTQCVYSTQITTQQWLICNGMSLFTTQAVSHNPFILFPYTHTHYIHILYQPMKAILAHAIIFSTSYVSMAHNSESQHTHHLPVWVTAKGIFLLFVLWELAIPCCIDWCIGFLTTLLRLANRINR